MKLYITILLLSSSSFLLSQVGIGTAAPSVELDIESSASTTSIDINNTAADGDPIISLQLTGVSKYTLGVDDSDGDKFMIGTTGLTTSTSIVIDGADVGIANTSPDDPLDVTGNIDLDGYIEMDNGVFISNIGTNNIFLGDLAGSDSYTSASWNVLIGSSSGRYITDGGENVVVGFRAGEDLASGDRNALFGAYAGTNVTAGYNVMLGYLAGYTSVDAEDNIMIGNEAGYDNTSGDQNVIIGDNAGHGVLGTGNVMLGNRAGYSETGSNTLYIDNSNTTTPLIYGDFSANTIKINGVLTNATVTIADGDATPDVAAGNVFTTSSNTGATAITDLDNPVVGSIVRIIGGSDTNSSTIADSGNFNLSGAWTANVDDVLILYVQADNDYIEIGRVNN